MNQMIVENIISWFLFALASTCTLSFASTMYDDFISRKRRGQETKTITKVVQLSDPKPNQLTLERPRGYDSPELFREDLWIKRIEVSRREHAALATSMAQGKTNGGVAEVYRKRLSAILAHHVDSSRDN